MTELWRGSEGAVTAPPDDFFRRRPALLRRPAERARPPLCRGRRRHWTSPSGGVARCPRRALLVAGWKVDRGRCLRGYGAAALQGPGRRRSARSSGRRHQHEPALVAGRKVHRLLPAGRRTFLHDEGRRSGRAAGSGSRDPERLRTDPLALSAGRQGDGADAHQGIRPRLLAASTSPPGTAAGSRTCARATTCSSFDVSPDGKQILFDRLRENSDVVLIDRPL